MATPGFNTGFGDPARPIYSGTQRPVMGGDLFSGFSGLNPNEGPTPQPGATPGGQGGFLGTLRDLLPSIINAGAAWYGNKNQAGEYQAAANQSTGRPTNVQSMFGNLAFDPATGIALTPGQGPGAFGGASPELINAFNQLNDQGSLNQEAGGRLDLLRQLAAPEEQRATQGLEQQLFSQGRLGGTGGSVQQEALARAQGSADLQRQLSSQDWARSNALQRFGAAQQTVGSGQNQQGINFGQLRDIGQLGVNAGRQPNADLLAAMAGSRGAGLQSIFGALGGNEEGGLGGVLAGLLGGGAQQAPSSMGQLGFLGQALGQNFGGNFGGAAGGIGSLLSGLDSKNYGQAAQGAGSLLGLLGGATGIGGLGKFGSVLGSLGGALGGGGGIASGLAGLLGGGGGGGLGGLAQGLSGLFGGSGALGSGVAGASSALGSGLGSLGSAAGSALGGLGAALGPIAGAGALFALPGLMTKVFGSATADLNKKYGTNMKGVLAGSPSGRQAWTQEFNRQRAAATAIPARGIRG